MMKYETFKSQVTEAGLEARKCNPLHWQIRGGKRLVNVWPETKRGFCFQAFGRTVHRGAQLEEAIEAAELPRRASEPPWQHIDVQVEGKILSPDVGIIRRFWRWLW